MNGGCLSGARPSTLLHGERRLHLILLHFFVLFIASCIIVLLNNIMCVAIYLQSLFLFWLFDIDIERPKVFLLYDNTKRRDVKMQLMYYRFIPSSLQ